MSLPRHLQELDDSLTRLDGPEGETMMLSELDGFLAGLVVCPELVKPSEWLPMVFGRDDEDVAAFENDSTMQDAIRLVFKHRDGIAIALAHGDGRYGPIFDVDTRNDDDVLWEFWMAGFQRAMALRPEAWTAIADDKDDEDASFAMAGMITLAAMADPDMDTTEIAAEAEELTAAAPDLIAEFVETLNGWRMRNTTDRPPQQPAAVIKVGRNEPCPCGSGKKFKKCCGMQ